MKLDRYSKITGRVLYWQYKHIMNEDDLRTLQEVFYRNGLYTEAEFDNKRYYLRVMPQRDESFRTNYVLHIFLFLLTALTTTITGAMLRGKLPFESLEQFSAGFPYSFALLSILLAHEMGHYISARIHKIKVTLPYFIPFFLPGLHPGTLGAFIKIRSPIPGKRALFDTGIAGPIAGFILSVFFIVLGYAQLPDAEGIFRYISEIHPVEDPDGINITLGSTILFDFLSHLCDGQRLPMNEMYHFPYIFAGWFGLLVTAINLMPIGQLDGGHITYALFGRPAKNLAIVAFVALILLNIFLILWYDSYVWVLWSILILVLIRFKHPATLNDAEKIGKVRRALGIASYIIFIVSFSPMPIYIP